jgi:hypothetical protein
MSNFQADLNLAHRSENKAIELMSELGTNLKRREGEFAPWDLEEGGLRVEVKCDLQTSKTGNIAIEVGKESGESGLGITQAQFWMIFYKENIWKCGLIKTQKLKDFVKGRRIINGGDRGHAHICLAPLVELKGEFDYVWSL